MMDHDMMIAAKVGILELLVRKLFVDQFLSMDDPIGNAIQSAETGVKFPIPKPSDNEIALAGREILQAFLDSIVSAVRSKSP